MDRGWRLIREESWAGPMNMALDDIAAQTVAGGGPSTLRVYQWDPSALSLGYNQSPSTVDWQYCEQEGISVTRRPTGGGGIYHDTHGDISYSIILPASSLPSNLLDSYSILLEPILEAFDLLDIPVQLADEKQPALHQPACYLRDVHPAHDVTVGQRKISGNAQYRQKDAIIQHGSLMYSRKPERHLGVFTDIPVTINEFNSRVTSIHEQARIERSRAVSSLERALESWVRSQDGSITLGSWTDQEIAAGRHLATEQYASNQWVRSP